MLREGMSIFEDMTTGARWDDVAVDKTMVEWMLVVCLIFISILSSSLCLLTFVNRCRHLSPSEINARLRDEIPHVTRLRLDDTVINYDDAICGPSTDNISLREGDPVLVKTGEGLVASCGSDFCHVLVKTKSQVDWQ